MGTVKMKSGVVIRTYRLCTYHNKCEQKSSCKHAVIHTHNLGEHLSIKCGCNMESRWQNGKGYCDKVN